MVIRAVPPPVPNFRHDGALDRSRTAGSVTVEEGVPGPRFRNLHASDRSAGPPHACRIGDFLRHPDHGEQGSQRRRRGLAGNERRSNGNDVRPVLFQKALQALAGRVKRQAEVAAAARDRPASRPGGLVTPQKRKTKLEAGIAG